MVSGRVLYTHSTLVVPSWAVDEAAGGASIEEDGAPTTSNRDWSGQGGVRGGDICARFLTSATYF